MRAAAAGYAAFAGTIDELRARSFARGHGKDDGLHPAHLLFGVLPAHLRLQRRAAGEHVEHPFQRPHAAQLPDLSEEVVEAELPRAQPALDLGSLLLVDGRLRLFDERQHVAHAQDAGRHALGLEDLEIRRLLAGAREPDRLSGGEAQRKRRAAP